jgi:hypothetical protein
MHIKFEYIIGPTAGRPKNRAQKWIGLGGSHQENIESYMYIYYATLLDYVDVNKYAYTLLQKDAGELNVENVA